ncbi:MAG: DUF2975 domain-containing protein [Pseudomonadota bacterium]
MRAIGKNSISSILAYVLHAARIIIWIGCVGLAIAVVMIPFAGGLLAWLQTFDNININGGIDVDGGDYLEIANHFITFLVLLFVVNRLLEILKTLRFGAPFEKENADRFRSVGYALLIGEAAKFAFGFLSIFIDAEIAVNVELTSIAAILSVFVLSEVFLEGARMKEEQDLTV